MAREAEMLNRRYSLARVATTNAKQRASIQMINEQAEQDKHVRRSSQARGSCIGTLVGAALAGRRRNSTAASASATDDRNDPLSC